jgi:hypothetical protein
MTEKITGAVRLNIDYVSALILIFTTGLLMISVILPNLLNELLISALVLSTSVIYLQWRIRRISPIEIASIVLFDAVYFIEVFTGENLAILIVITVLSIILVSAALTRKDLMALAPIVALIIEGMFSPFNSIEFLWILIILSILPLASSKRIHSLLPLLVSFPLILVSPNNIVSTLITLTYTLFISNSIETSDKCPFRREISLVIGGFFIQAAIILLTLLSYKPSILLSYWVLGYMISAIGLTSPPFYKPSPENEVVYRRGA